MIENFFKNYPLSFQFIYLIEFNKPDFKDFSHWEDKIIFDIF